MSSALLFLKKSINLLRKELFVEGGGCGGNFLVCPPNEEIKLAGANMFVLLLKVNELKGDCCAKVNRPFEPDVLLLLSAGIFTLYFASNLEIRALASSSLNFSIRMSTVAVFAGACCSKNSNTFALKVFCP